MSHEIRTPIHGFTVISEGLVEQWYNLPENKKYNYAVEISNNAKRLQKLLDNLLDLSKLNNHKIKVNFRPIDLNDILINIINECTSLYLNKKHIDITYDSSNKMIVSGDKEKIEQVLRNIFFNAIKFTPNGGFIKANIKIKNNNVYFSLADSGVGIPNEDLLEIFEPFSQSSRTKNNAGGTGLGLSISKQIIDLHGGKIWAENNIKHGATIHFTIPLN